MSILALIVLMLGQIFSDATRAHGIGMRKTRLSLSGRSVLSYMVDELNHAFAGGGVDTNFLYFKVNNNGSRDEVFFYMIKRDSGMSYESDLNAVKYQTAPAGGSYELRRGSLNVDAGTDYYNIADESVWGMATYPVAPNIDRFDLELPSDYPAGVFSNRLPAYLDIYLGSLASSRKGFVQVYSFGPDRGNDNGEDDDVVSW